MCISATVPLGTRGVFLMQRAALWTWAWIWFWYCFLSLKGSQGVISGRSRSLPDFTAAPFFMFFFKSFSDPLKSTFGVHLVPNWCQNDPKKWAWVGPRRHQKLTSWKKLKNSLFAAIYYTSAMSTPPKRHQFWSLKSPKIKEKMNLENKPQKEH